jgi:hypothetical protein
VCAGGPGGSAGRRRFGDLGATAGQIIPKRHQDGGAQLLDDLPRAGQTSPERTAASTAATAESLASRATASATWFRSRRTDPAAQVDGANLRRGMPPNPEQKSKAGCPP